MEKNKKNEHNLTGAVGGKVLGNRRFAYSIKIFANRLT
jgi:hypothetical protein